MLELLKKHQALLEQTNAPADLKEALNNAIRSLEERPKPVPPITPDGKIMAASEEAQISQDFLGSYPHDGEVHYSNHACGLWGCKPLKP
jgi:hypothetical protein